MSLLKQLIQSKADKADGVGSHYNVPELSSAAGQLLVLVYTGPSTA